MSVDVYWAKYEDYSPPVADLVVTSPPYPGLRGCDMSPSEWESWMVGEIMPKMIEDTTSTAVIVINADAPADREGWTDSFLFTDWLPAVMRCLPLYLVSIEPMILTNAPPRGNLRGKTHRRPRHSWEPVFIFARSRNGVYTYHPPLAPYKAKTRSRKGRGAGRGGGYTGGHQRVEGMASGPDYFMASTTGGRNVPTSRGGSFPIRMPLRYIRMFTNPGDMVLDPFCGVGRTMFAAYKLGRSAIGIEKDPTEAGRAKEWMSLYIEAGVQRSLFEAKREEAL